ncbi:MAG: hypothetical protein ACRYG8_14495 [Janthinobacterium lividum]
MIARILRCALLAWLLLPIAALAQPSPFPTSSCEYAASLSERTHHLPPGLLVAIGHVESGRQGPSSRQIEGWPWTVNEGGIGHFFATRGDAIVFVKGLWANGIRSIDVGCFQINLLYHSTAFRSLEQAFEPSLNADYASYFLNSLYQRDHTWGSAVADYHSSRPGKGIPYRNSVELHLASDLTTDCNAVDTTTSNHIIHYGHGLPNIILP